jgi:hypothetical protein
MTTGLEADKIIASITNPYSLGAYVAGAILAMWSGHTLLKVRAVTRHIRDGHAALEAIRIVTNTILPPSITAEQWLRSNRQRGITTLLVTVLLVIMVVAVVSIVSANEEQHIINIYPSTQIRGGAIYDTWADGIAKPHLVGSAGAPRSFLRGTDGAWREARISTDGHTYVPVSQFPTYTEPEVRSLGNAPPQDAGHRVGATASSEPPREPPASGDADPASAPAASPSASSATASPPPDGADRVSENRPLSDDVFLGSIRHSDSPACSAVLVAEDRILTASSCASESDDSIAFFWDGFPQLNADPSLDPDPATTGCPVRNLQTRKDLGIAILRVALPKIASDALRRHEPSFPAFATYQYGEQLTHLDGILNKTRVHYNARSLGERDGADFLTLNVQPSISTIVGTPLFQGALGRRHAIVGLTVSYAKELIRVRLFDSATVSAIQALLAL